MSTGPLYSFVATSRNDDHGGDILRRTQSWITRLAQQANRHQVRCELVLVDWNPPRSRAPLSDVVGWPRGSEWFSARVLTVPPPLHRRLRFSDRLQMFQMIAKNVGIRRAHGDFIIATNVDIIFSDEVFDWLKNGNPVTGKLYRSDRWDIPNEIQLEPDLDVLLRRARQEAIRRNLRDGTYIRGSGGDFVNTTDTQFDASFYKPLRRKLESLRSNLTSSHSLVPGELIQSLDEIADGMEELREDFFIPLLHTNGCGDFTILARHDWFVLRGYPEWNIFSWAIDSAVILQAHFNGIPIEELGPMLTHYHIEHDYGSGWTPEGSSSLWARLDQQGIPYLRYEHMTRIAKELIKNNDRGMFTIYNDYDWGLADADIPSEDIVRPNTAPRGPRKHNEGRLTEVIERVVLADIPLEATSAHAGSRVTTQLSADGLIADLIVRTAPEMWSYSVMLDVTEHTRETGEFWISAEICVDFGTVYVGVLNRTRDNFLVQAGFPGPTAGYVETRIFVRDAAEIGGIVFRNGDAGGTTQFRVRAIRILGESVPEEAAATSSTLPVSPGDLMRNLAFAEKQRLRLAEALAVLHLELAVAEGQTGEGMVNGVVP